MKINIKDNPELFVDITEFKVYTIRDEHRRQSNFYRQVVVEFKEDSGEPYSKYIGFWRTNVYIYDTEYGMADDYINELTKVEKKEIEKTITVTEWQEIE